MQLTQRKCKDTTVKSKKKVESAFASIPGKSTRLFLLDEISFPEPKAESALGPKQGKPSRLFLLTWFSNFSFLLSFTYYPTTICSISDYILRIIRH